MDGMKSDRPNLVTMNFSLLLLSFWLLEEVLKRHRKGGGEKERKLAPSDLLLANTHHRELDEAGEALAWGETDAQRGWTNHNAVGGACPVTLSTQGQGPEH